MGYICMCCARGYGFPAILIINRSWFLHPRFELGRLFLQEATLSSLSIKMKKSPSQIMFRAMGHLQLGSRDHNFPKNILYYGL